MPAPPQVHSGMSPEQGDLNEVSRQPTAQVQPWQEPKTGESQSRPTTGSFANSQVRKRASGSLARSWRAQSLPKVHEEQANAILPWPSTLPLYGREQTRDQLWQQLALCYQDQHPRFVLIRGPVGVGKDRMASWLAERAHELGVARYLRLGGLADCQREFCCSGSSPMHALLRVGPWKRVGEEICSEGDNASSDLNISRSLRLTLEGGKTQTEKIFDLEKVLLQLSKVPPKRPIVLLLDGLTEVPSAMDVIANFIALKPKARLLFRHNHGRGGAAMPAARCQS